MITTVDLKLFKEKGEKLTMLTAYEASFARLMENAGVELLLVGDSLGMVVQGNENTTAVKLEDILYHTKLVAKATSRSLILSDLPFGTYEIDAKQAFGSAVKIIQAGAKMVKLEGGEEIAPTVNFLSSRGIPVCAHIGLTPQSIHGMGRYAVQGRSDEEAQRLIREAQRHEEAGASLIVLECIPMALAKTITSSLSIPTIGIGAGKDCDGQVLVMHDMLGIYPTPPKFVKNFMQDASSIKDAFERYVNAVKKGTFPTKEHSYQ